MKYIKVGDKLTIIKNIKNWYVVGKTIKDGIARYKVKIIDNINKKTSVTCVYTESQLSKK